jgi:hypothetical protein
MIMKKIILSLILVFDCSVALGSTKSEYLKILRQSMPIFIHAEEEEFFSYLGGLAFIPFRLDTQLTHVNNKRIEYLMALPSCQKNPDPCLNDIRKVEVKRVNTVFLYYTRLGNLCERYNEPIFKLCLNIHATALRLHFESDKLEPLKQLIIKEYEAKRK